MVRKDTRLSGMAQGVAAPIFASMAEQEKPLEGGRRRKRGRLARLRSKYRLVLIDDGTFAERFSIRLSRLNLLLLTIVAFGSYGLLIGALIVFTPLKRYIPGYSDQETKLNAYRSLVLADSLEVQLDQRDRYIDALRMVLSGELPADSSSLFRPSELKPGLADLQPGRPDSLLRERMERDEAYSLTEDKAAGERRELAGTFFFPPLRGIVTSTFDRSEGHFGVDIVGKADAAVKACLEGTVTLASWTTDAGHVLHVQHRNELVSIYKHNSVLLKKVGDRVKAGEAIAIVGNSGEYTSGPHLHFELWKAGEPVDPRSFMSFE